MRISDVIGTKSSQDVITIAPDATVRDLIALLAEHNVGALIVSTDGAAVDGIVSERDVVRRLHRRRRRPRRRRVADHDRRGRRPAEPDTSLDELEQMMTERRIRHVPVVKDGRLTGIISIGDVVKAASTSSSSSATSSTPTCTRPDRAASRGQASHPTRDAREGTHGQARDRLPRRRRRRPTW